MRFDADSRFDANRFDADRFDANRFAAVFARTDTCPRLKVTGIRIFRGIGHKNTNISSTRALFEKIKTVLNSGDNRLYNYITFVQ